MTKRLKDLGIVLALALTAGACAAGRAFHQGDVATRNGDLDSAVAAYRTAVQADPDNPRYKIALERTMLAASRAHLERAQKYEQQDQLEAALGEYRLASEYDPSNRGIAFKVSTLEKTIRDRLEAARPKPAGQQLRAAARAASPEPILNPSVDRLNIIFTNVGFKDVLNFIASNSGINVTYDREVVDRPMTIQVNDITVEQGLNQIMTMNQLSYKIVNQKSIFVFNDQPNKHTQYDEQVIKTFYIQHADVTELGQILSAIMRLPQIAIQPVISFNKTNNTMTIRASTTMMQIFERIIEQNDKPRAEIVFDVEILEVDRERAKSYGLNLSEFSLGTVFSPEVAAPSAAAPATNTGTATGNTAAAQATAGQSTSPSQVRSPPPFNLNTISRGVSTADFYLAVPTAIVRFLESDTHSRLLAKPQLRGAEGTKLTLNLGQEVPIVTTSYTPIATGGVGVNPLNSFQLKSVGINIDLTPRVTLDGDILIDVNVESNSKGPDQNIAGTNYPSFVTRKVGTRLRLRDGESNLLAGLLREDEQNAVQGFPGAIHVPLLKQALSNNTTNKTQIDLIMLLTPHIVRSNEITDVDLRPIYIGSQQNLGIGGPPPLITPAEPGPAAPAPTPPPTPPASAPRAPGADPGAPASPPLTPPGTVLAPPPGSTPIPGVVVVPQPPPAQPNPPAPATPTPPAPVPPQPQTLPPTTLAPTPTPAPGPATTAPEQATTAGVGAAQILISTPGTTFRVGQGPYTVAISIANASRLSTVSLTLTYDPAMLRVRAVQEGSFMRTGGATATFTQQQAPGRLDVTIARANDAGGATGTGLLTAVIFDAIAPGTVTLSPSGSATGPGGTAMGLQFRPVTVAVQQ
jgi:general secretion pathway protein D